MFVTPVMKECEHARKSLSNKNLPSMLFWYRSHKQQRCSQKEFPPNKIGPGLVKCNSANVVRILFEVEMGIHSVTNILIIEKLVLCAQNSQW